MENSKIFKKRFMKENLQTATVRQTSYAKKMGILLATLALVFCLSFPVVGQERNLDTFKPDTSRFKTPIPQEKQATFTGSAEEIVAKYLSEHFPDYVYVGPFDFFGIEKTYTYNSPWLISADFDGNGHIDFAFFATKKSNLQLMIIILSNFGNTFTHTVVRENIILDADNEGIGLVLQEPRGISTPVDRSTYVLGDGSEIHVGNAKYPFFVFGQYATCLCIDTYWWENNRYNSANEKAKSYRENPANIGIVNTAQDALNLRESPSLNAGIIEKLPRGSKVLVINRPKENKPWVEILFEEQVGWVHGQYLTF
ncbi:MAG: SH3 domain-containing protein [Candidatus Hydrogenedentes bacterium]|nr:SH3 domain-containing protein [Candidatus Hydrogenedentota bacterium]